MVREGKTLWTGQIDTPKLKERKIIRVSYNGWEPGQVQLVIREVGPGGVKSEVGKIELRVPSKAPDWLGFKMPAIPAVPSPWVPVKASAMSAVVWGREYSFGHSPFLDQVRAVAVIYLPRPWNSEARSTASS